jgi:iron complex transport system permease protein
MLVLTGIAVNAVANAIIAFLVFSADTASREQVTFWQLGSLNGATWSAVAVTVPLLVAGVGGAWALARRLDALALGERSARHLGVDVERVRLWAVLIVALLTAAAVSYAGIIAFVGLIIPHLLRLLIGPSHGALIPASALGGALLISGSDLVARTAIPFADLPIGMFTALVGGPVFFVLLRRTIGAKEGQA